MKTNKETRKLFLESLQINKKEVEPVVEETTKKETKIPVMKTKKLGTKRDDLRAGTKVKIVQKHHQKTGELTEGVVKDILTNSSNHHRGIKVRLESGLVGRVQEILNNEMNN